MEVKISASAPQLIDPVPDDHPLVQQQVRKALEALASGKAKFVTLHNACRLFKYGDKFEGAYFLVHGSDENPLIIYLVRYSRVSIKKGLLNTKNALRQVLVWRRENAPSSGSANVARRVFFDYLLPEFGALVTDTQQTARGKAFWDYALLWALEKGLVVSVINTRQQKSQIVHSVEELESLNPAVWGKQFWFRDVIAAISLPTGE